VCPKFGKNPVNDVGPREFTRNVLDGQDGMMNGSVTISCILFWNDTEITICHYLNQHEKKMKYRYANFENQLLTLLASNIDPNLSLRDFWDRKHINRSRGKENTFML
jgi:hypothetical protein